MNSSDKNMAAFLLLRHKISVFIHDYEFEIHFVINVIRMILFDRIFVAASHQIGLDTRSKA